MRPSPTRLAVATAAAVLAALAPALPAAAGQSHTIAASPTNPRPGDTVTVTGTSQCPSSPYTVTLSYTDPEGATRTATASGTSDAEGAYSQAITVPETAVAGEPASVQSAFSSCNQPSPEPESARLGTSIPSNTVALTITAHAGTLSVSPTSGPPGTRVTITGANCWGDDIVVAFTEGDDATEVEPVTLNDDRTFSATFVVPGDAATGNHSFVAECPGSDFPEVLFVVTAAPAPPAPPAAPVPGQPTFTG